MSFQTRAIQASFALIPLAGIILMFFPGVVGLPPKGPAWLDSPFLRIVIALGVMTFAAWAAVRTTGGPVASTSLIVAGPTLVLGGILGVFASLRPADLVITLALVLLAGVAAYFGATVAKRA